MHKIAFAFIAFVLAASALANVAHAQETTTAEEPAALSLQLEQPFTLTYEDFRRGELERSIRRSRNALIGSSAAAIVGAAVFFPLAVSCVDYSFPEGSEVRCSSRGAQAGLSISGMVLTGAFVGVLVTGIMLGVRKGKLRRLDDRGRYGDPDPVAWDPVRSRFVF